MYDAANRETIISANGGGGGKGGRIANGNSGGNGFETVGTQGSGGYTGTGITKIGNEGKGGIPSNGNGASGGSSESWSSETETVVNPLIAGSGGNCPTVGVSNGASTAGNGGANGSDGFVRVYWIP